MITTFHSLSAMRNAFYALALLWAFATTAVAQSAGDVCHLEVPCELGQRSYHVKEPDGWDGKSAMPVLIHFHGWQRTGALPVQHRRISGATRRRGVLLIAPNGRRKTWDFWHSETADVGFAQAVIEDVMRRYPIDKGNVFVSGYSYGSIMAWRFACDRGDAVKIRALLGVSGTLDQDEVCAGAPQEIRHVHGQNDNVLRFPYGQGGDTTYPVSLWRNQLNCSEQVAAKEDWSVVNFLTFSRVEWHDCAPGTKVILDVHPGGHFIPHGWIGRQLDELLNLPLQYP